MQDVVIDTNILISSFYSSKGSPAKIMSMFDEEKIRIIYSEEIMKEYADVLSREKHNISIEEQKLHLKTHKRIRSFNPPLAKRPK